MQNAPSSFIDFLDVTTLLIYSSYVVRDQCFATFSKKSYTPRLFYSPHLLILELLQPLLVYSNLLGYYIYRVSEKRISAGILGLRRKVRWKSLWITLFGHWFHMASFRIRIPLILFSNQNITQSPSQSAPTILKNLKNGAPCSLQKSRLKKTGTFFIQKEKRPGCLFSFWITMTLVFCTLFFSKSRVPDF